MHRHDDRPGSGTMEATGGRRSGSCLRGTTAPVTHGSRHKIRGQGRPAANGRGRGGGLYGGGRVTLGDLLDQFLASATLGPTTRADWLSVTERHLKPALGHMPLWKLTSRDCDQLYARMKAAGLGQSRVRCAHVVLHRGVAQAVRWGWLVRNPVSNATRPRREESRSPLPGSMTFAPRSCLPGRSTWSCGAGCRWRSRSGARRGEVCALRWCDVDLDKRFVRIERSVSATSSAGVVIKSTKTGKPRVVSLTTQATNAFGSAERKPPGPPQLSGETSTSPN